MKKKLSNRLFSFLMAASMMVSQANSLTLTTLAEEIEESPTAIEEVVETGSPVVDEDKAEAEEESADLAEESETTEAEGIKEDEEQKEEKKDEEKVDVSSLNGMDFSSKRLLVATDSIDDEAVVGSYNNVYLLQYETEYDAKVAYLEYTKTAYFVDIDYVVSVADEANVSGGEMTEEANPIAELSEEVNEISAVDQGKIVLIDTGASNANVVDAVSVIGDATADDNGHGTNMANAIVSQNKNAKIVSVKALDASGHGTVSSIYAGIKLATEMGAKYINLSVSGIATAENESVRIAIQEAVASGITVIGAAGNNGKDASYYVPANVSEAIIVGACDAKGNKLPASNYGATVDYNVVAGSTSEASAKMTGYISKMGTVSADKKLVFPTNYVASDEAEDSGKKEGTVAHIVGEYDPYRAGHGYKLDLELDGSGFMAADSAVVTGYADAGEWNYSGSYYINQYGYYLSNGVIAFCGDWNGGQPVIGTGGQIGDSDNANIRRALYYGYGGPGNVLGHLSSAAQLAITTELVQYANAGYTDLMAAWGGSRGQGFAVNAYSYIYNYPDPAEYGYTAKVVYLSQNGVNSQYWLNGSAITAPQQNVFYGEYKPYWELSVEKSSSNPDMSDGNSCYSLEGTTYKLYASVEDAENDENAIETFVMDAEGKTETVAEELMVGQTYYLKETKAGKGYELDTEIHPVTDEGNDKVTFEAEDVPGNDPVFIVLKKKGMDGVGVAGAQYTVKYYADYYTVTNGNLVDSKGNKVTVGPTRTWVFETDEDGYIDFTDEYLISGKLYYDVDVKGDLRATIPFGTITVEETVAPSGFARKEGYLPFNDGKYQFQIGEEEWKFIFDENAYEHVELPIEISTTAKAADGTKKVHAGVKETIVDTIAFTNLTAGKEYEISGKIYDKATAQPLVVDGKEVTATKKFSPRTSNGTVDVEFTFVIPATVNDLVVYEELTRSENGSIIERVRHEDINDKGQTVQVEKPTVGTNAFGKDNGSKDLPVNGEMVTIIDYVDYTGLSTSGHEYTVTGYLMIKETEEPLLINGEKVTAEKKFVPSKPDGTVTLEYTVNTKDLPKTGKNEYVVFEDLISDEGVEIATHHDIDSYKQTIRFVEVKTTAIADETGSDDIQALDKVQTINDIVEVTILDTNTEEVASYTLTATLMNKETGEPVEINGATYTATKTFVPTEETMTVKMPIKINLKPLEGKQVVFFETLTKNTKDGKKVEIAEHNDINDDKQTIQVVNIGTKANINKTVDAIDGDSLVTISDDVSYKGLKVGHEYKMEGTAYNKKTGEVFKDSQGKTYTASKTFTPTTPDGVVTIDVQIKASELNTSIVMFESLKNNDIIVAVHADIKDKGQTIPHIYTTADIDKSENIIEPDSIVTITDNVHYDALDTAKTYKLVGVLMDSKTNKPFVDSEGKTYTVEKEFKPATETGTVSLDFSLKAKELKTVTVVFESLYENTTLVAIHSDINDKSQTIPVVLTNANIEGTENVVDGNSIITITDCVEYFGVDKTKEYSVVATLMDTDKKEVFVDADGNTYSKEITFKPEAENGTIDVTFEVPQKYLTTSVTFFEDLYKENKRVSAHADIRDKSQTIPKISTTANINSTKDVIDENSTITITDQVKFENLDTSKEYVLKGTLMDKKTGKEFKDSQGKTYTVEKTFKPETESGTVSLDFQVKAKELKTVTVVFESLYDDGKLLSIHADINDKGQTLPYIHTNANINKTKDLIDGDSLVTISDEVVYESLTPSKEYVLKGTLMDKKTGKEFKDSQGKTYTVEKKFKPEKANGSVVLDFQVKAKELKTVTVVFESLYDNGKLLSIHADINDKGQTIPLVETEADINGTGDVIDGESIITITDCVKYSGVDKTKEYSVVATLMDTDKGEVFVDADGNTYSKEITFKPEAENGTIDVTFEIAQKYLTTSVTFFEDLYDNNKKVSAHADIKDTTQTIPEVKTTATSDDTKDHVDVTKEEIKLTDVVAFKNLEVGREYTVKGVLMNKETKKPLLVEGKEVTAETTFTPETKDGEVELHFTFNSIPLNGVTTVAFETLYRDGKKLAVHADIEDEGQTVEIKPQNVVIQKVDQNNNIVLGAELEIIDLNGVYESWTVGQVVDGWDEVFPAPVEEEPEEDKADSDEPKAQAEGDEDDDKDGEEEPTEPKVEVFEPTVATMEPQTVEVGTDIWTIEDREEVATISTIKDGTVFEVELYNLTIAHEDGTHERFVVDAQGQELLHRVQGYLAEGGYTLHEATAPEKAEGIEYKPAEDVEFVIELTDEQILVQMVDIKTDTVEITKYDATNMKELSGAKLKVTDKDGKVVDEWTSTKEQHKIAGLVVGETYKLTETIAPKGYAIAETIEFTVEDNGKVVQQVKMLDKLLPKKKTKTGLTNGTTYMAAGFVTCALVAGLMIIKRRKATKA